MSPPVQCCWDRIHSLCQPLWQQLAESETAAATAAAEAAAAANVGDAKAGDTSDDASFCLICRLLQQQAAAGGTSYSSSAAAGGPLHEAFEMLRQQHKHVYLPARRAPLPLVEEYAQGLRGKAAQGAPTGGPRGAAVQKRGRETPTVPDDQQRPQQDWRRQLLLAREAGAFDVCSSNSSSSSSSSQAKDATEGRLSSSQGDATEQAILIAAAIVGREEREALAQQFLLRIYGERLLRCTYTSE